MNTVCSTPSSRSSFGPNPNGFSHNHLGLDHGSNPVLVLMVKALFILVIIVFILSVLVLLILVIIILVLMMVLIMTALVLVV